MRQTLPDCCPRAASGQASTAPPRAAINSRRLMPDMGFLPRWCRRSVHRTLNLPHKGRQVLGPDLNRSESGWDAADRRVLPPTIAHTVRRETAAPRDFNSAFVHLGSEAAEIIGTVYVPCPLAARRGRMHRNKMRPKDAEA